MYHIDWLELTEFDGNSEFMQQMAISLHKMSRSVEGRGRFGYDKSTVWFDGAVTLLHPSDAEQSRMGWHWIFTATSNDLLSYGGLFLVMRNFLAYSNGNVTRLDLAVDSHDHLLTVADVRTITKHAMHEGIIRKRSDKAFVADETVETWYLGSRRSDIFVRVYDKGIQTETFDAGIWTRIEFELKGREIRSLADAARLAIQTTPLNHWLERIVAGYLLSFFPSGVHKMAGWDLWAVSPLFTSLAKKEIDPDHWWRSTVRSAMIKRLASFEDKVTAQHWLRDFLLSVADGLPPEYERLKIDGYKPLQRD
jgi:hypothetical protein